jgi:beta-barrel assembly-enhancing protease
VRRDLALFSASLALIATTANAAVGVTPGVLRAPHVRPAETSSEGGLWGLSDKAEAAVKVSAELEPDPALNAYAKRVVCKLAPEYCDELRVYILTRPFFNASAAPNGYMEVNSGLLLRVQDESELAFVLGHEISHFARSHSLAQLEALKSNANAALMVSLVISAGAAAASYSAASSGSMRSANSISSAASTVSNLTYLAALSNVFAFSREQESEADRLGLERARAAGYRTSASISDWEGLLAETAASDFEKVRKSETHPSMFATHPVTLDRIADLKAAGAGPADTPDISARRAYRAVLRPHLTAWLRDELRRRDYGETLFLLDRLGGLGEDTGVIEYYRGEAYRLRRKDGDAAQAVAAYRRAAAAADCPAAALRELGDLLIRTGDKASAKGAYADYLVRAPNAEDRWLVEDALKTL